MLALLTVLSTAAIGRTALAEPDAATVVLGLEALDGAPDNVASEITDALRQRVAGTHGFQLVQGKDLVEVKLVFSCPDEGSACMAQAGKSMGATKLIFGNVRREGTDYQVALKLFDVNRAVIEGTANEAIQRRKAEPSVFRSLAPAWIGKLTGKVTGAGSLQIRANVAGADVALDGTHVGITGADPVTVADVSPGRHEISVEKSGYTTTKQDFTLGAGQSLPLSLNLSSMSVDVGDTVPPETPPVIVRRPKDAPDNEGGGAAGPTGPTWARVGFWVAVVGVAGTLAGGAYFAKHVNDINGELDQFRRFPCKNDPQMTCNSSGDPKAPVEKSMYSRLEDQGNRDQKLEKILFGVSAGVALVGGYFLYRGYLDSDNEKTTASRGLRIFPTASASAGGIVTEFDF
ncbi:MAG TPA: PEGA domain-containing protein [Polyangia bacterium]|nr:PEGA domain-containing protein [Polyangia bacterium]